MFTQKIHTEPCSRRKFVLASGLFVVGGLVSCGGEQLQKQSSVVAQTPKHIRVRIGKNVQRATVGDFVFSSHSMGTKPKTIEINPKTQVVISGKTKTITGKIVLHPKQSVSNTSFDVVAHVPIEQYLPGVIAGELFAHWHVGTFAAQAVAARSYAIAQHLQRKTTTHYDVTDGPSSQMFLGDVTLDVAHRAVKETKGIVLRWNDEIVPTYYSACCGGLAATATDAISGAAEHDIPPLRGHDGKDFCMTVDVHRWSANRSAKVLRKRLNACAKHLKLPELSNIRTIRSIEPIATNRHGRPTELVIYGRRNEACAIEAKNVVRAVNAPISSLPKVTQQAWSSHFAGQKAGSSLQLEGFGMGHGVGLCQYGAQELAGRGESWQNILSWYCPQATITT